MENENLVHVKFEYEEAIEFKRELLSIQRDVLRSAIAIKNYTLKRKKELKEKEKLHTKIKNLNKNIKKFKNLVPKIKIPSAIHRLQKTSGKKQPDYDSNIESQLLDIQAKLAALQ